MTDNNSNKINGVNDYFNELRNHSPVTFGVANEIDNFLIGWDKLSIIPIVNMMTVRLEVAIDVPTNSNVIIIPSGGGKNTFLNHILQRGNPNDIIKLPAKIFESSIIEMPDKHFQQKVWTLEDMLVSFRGLDKKQNEQLFNFFIALLADREYERKKPQLRLVKDANVSCMFGVASEGWRDYHGQLNTSTFLERLVPIYYDWTDEIKYKVMLARLERSQDMNKIDPPAIKLPLDEPKVRIKIPRKFKAQLFNLVNHLHKKTRLSPPRAVEYIQNFIRANALLNGRDEVTEWDIKTWEYVQDLHYPSQLGTPKDRIYQLVVVSKEPLDVKQVSNSVNVSEYLVRKYLDQLSREGAVRYDKISHGRVIYWVE